MAPIVAPVRDRERHRIAAGAARGIHEGDVLDIRRRRQLVAAADDRLIDDLPRDDIFDVAPQLRAVLRGRDGRVALRTPRR